MAENESIAVRATSTLAEVEAAQIDQQIATAKRYPRDEKLAVEKAVTLATFNAKTSQSCIYFRPVGKKDGIQTFAEGPSIRLAECLKACWGNLRLGTRVVGEQDGNIHVQAVCHDLENNVFETSEVARSITGQNGRYKDTMIQVVIGAASKIALRNVIFSVIPRAYAEQIMEACKSEIVGSEEDRVKLIDMLKASFKEMGVSEKTMYTAVDRREYPEDSNSEAVFLLGLHNAIKDELCTIDEVFGKQSSKPEGLTKPEEIKEDKPKAAGRPKGSKNKTAEDATTFEETLRATALQAGFTEDAVINIMLKDKFDIDSIETVPPEKMGDVIALFEKAAERK